MSIYSSRGISHYGYFGHAMAAFGASDNPVVGDLGFSHPGSLQDFLTRDGDGGWNHGLKAYNLTYNGPSAAVISSANSGYQALMAMSELDPAAETKMAVLKKKTQMLLDNIDAITKSKGPFGGLPQSLETQRVNYMKDLVRLLLEWQKAPSSLPKVADAAGVPSVNAVNEAILAKALSQNAISAKYVPGDGTSGADNLKPPEASSNTLLYVGLGVGILALGAGVFLLKRPKSVAGYRRRSKLRSRR